jgi:DNA-binding NtrC family response regulator
MHARLSVENGSAIPANHELRADEPITLGRGLDNTIVLPDKCASKQHARIFHDNGRWFICDLDSRNGVLVNGRRVHDQAELPSGAEIALGDIRFRFMVEPFPSSLLAAAEGSVGGEDAAAAEVDAAVETAFLADELTGLYRFLSRSLKESEPHGLIRLALETLLRQTRADLVGFRSLDVEDLLLVLPEQAQVDACLSGRLTEKALTEGITVWLAAPMDDELSGASLSGLRDALCVPLRDQQPGGAYEPPLGAVHAYRRTQPFTEREAKFCEVLAGCLAACLRGVLDRRALLADHSRLRLGSPGRDDEIIGDSPAIRRLHEQIARLADHAGSVLIVGETGSGKELVALGLHRASRRRAGPLVTVNCASLNPNTAAAEFFGHAPGAFTSAGAEHPGFFQQADGGALFLDEIGELSQEMQGMLLRVLETHRFRPMKATKDIKVDVRVLAATNRDLEREVRAGRFRSDLFFRFTVAIKTPPLREHLVDVPALAQHFLSNLRKSDPRPLTLTEAALRRLQSYSWPGNVRQLRYLLEGAAALSRDGRIDAADLHLPEEQAGSSTEMPLKLDELEVWAIRRALAQTGGNNTKAAEALGIHRDTLIAKIRKYGIGREG